MRSAYLLFLTLGTVVFLGFLIPQARADDANGISIQNISVQPHAVKVGDVITVTATLVNNSTGPIFVSDMINRDCQGPFFTVSFDNHIKVAAAAGVGKTCSYVGLQERLDPGKRYTGTSPGLFFTYTATKPGTANVTVTFPYGIKNQTDPNQSNIDLTISKSSLFTIYDNNTNISMLHHGGPPIPSLGFLTPLKQLKSGVAAKDVTCKPSLQLILKAENNSPICVTSDTAMTLLKRGWAMSSLKNFGYNPGRGPVSPEPKESGQFSSIGPNPFPSSTLNRLVFFIKSNSTAQIHVQYTSEFENTGNVDTGGQFYTGNPHDFIPLNSSQILISSSPDHVSMSYGTNTTVIYTISTKNITSGLYWVFLTQICGVMPVAIDMNSSQITPSDIPVYSQHCPAQFLNAKILGISGGTTEYMQSQELQ